MEEIDKRLGMKVRKSIGRKVAERYQKARKGEKARILDEYTKLLGYTRCYAAWLLRHWGRRVVVWSGKQRVVLVGSRFRNQKGKRKRPPVYDQRVQEALRTVWRILEFPSGKRLAPYLGEFTGVLERTRELGLEADIRDKLVRMSAATIDRLLRGEKKKLLLKRRCHTKPGSLLRSQIRIRTFADWDEQKPGFVEMDLVSHEGSDSSGMFAQTLDVTDVLTGWTETVAVRNKAQVFRGIVQVRKQFPFPWLGIDCDSGGEFINHHLERYCLQEHLDFTKGRSYNRNDSCYVKQKNWHIVRRTVGYCRYDTAREVSLLNQIYRRLRLYTNFFQPQMKCIQKTRIGSKMQKRYDIAKTPYQRVRECPDISPEVKETLRQEYTTLNPVQLKREINHLQLVLFDLAGKKMRARRSMRKNREKATALQIDLLMRQ